MDFANDFSEYSLAPWTGDVEWDRGDYFDDADMKRGFNFRAFISTALIALALSCPAYAERAEGIGFEKSSATSGIAALSLSTGSFVTTGHIGIDGPSASIHAAPISLQVRTDFRIKNDWFLPKVRSVHGKSIRFQGGVSETRDIADLIAPSETVRMSNSLKRAIGSNGAGRIAEFARFASGWDAGSGASLNRQSLIDANLFFDKAEDQTDGMLDFAAKKPSVFMSHSGNIVINWLDHEENLMEIEFKEHSIDYYIESTGEEGSTLTRYSATLINKLFLS